MKILIILPNWLGDALMSTPAIESLLTRYPDAALTLVGSEVAIAALRHHPRCTQAVVDRTKQGGSRLRNTRELAKTLGRHDLALTFRNQLHSTLLLRWTGSGRTLSRRSWHSRLLLDDAVTLPRTLHLVEQYQRLADRVLGSTGKPGSLRLFLPPQHYHRPTLGINPGATYGSAKRWYPEKFAAVAAHFAETFEIIIFGGPNELKMADAIATELNKRGVIHYRNLAGKTSVESLCAHIGGLSLFITNDSGPMHVAAAYQVPTVAVFGPTRHKETSPWGNPKAVIVRHDIECAPCMRRECPLKHHECMKSITPEEVIRAARAQFQGLGA